MMKKLLIACISVFLLSACGGGSDSSPAQNQTIPIDDTNNSQVDINTTQPDINTTQPDTQVPVIMLIGDANVSLVQGEKYIEYGASASDDVDGDLVVTISGSVNSANAGVYTVVYLATDKAGNSATLSRTITVNQQAVCEAKYSDEMMAGRELYNETCKLCHASDAKSGDFDIRGSRVSDIDTAMEEVVEMIELNLAEQVSAQQRALISLYLIEIRDNPDVEFGNDCNNSTSLTKASLGSKLFFDANLSLRKTLSCSSCHNPTHAFSDARFQQVGDTNPVEGALSVGDDGTTLGGRNAPTATYAQFTPTFGRNANGEYFGGQFHDGCAATLKEQAKGPFLDQAEMMMHDGASVVARVLENSEYIEEFKTLFGEDIFDDKEKAYEAVAESIAKFEKTDIFAPFNSKYDRSKLDVNDEDYYEMSAVERQGYALFFDTNKTNCVLCHAINSKTESSFEIFTNFKYENIGTPKNLQALLARDGNTDKTDLGLGGRADMNASSEYGKVRVPTLRNIAVTNPYMSNGVFKELRTVLEFYNHMSGEDNTTLNPETGKMWEDAEVTSTINHESLEMELLDDAELDALEAFLKLLTDKSYEALVK